MIYIISSGTERGCSGSSGVDFAHADIQLLGPQPYGIAKPWLFGSCIVTIVYSPNPILMMKALSYTLWSIRDPSSLHRYG